MLEGLDQVPWHTLEHAYGTADDVPDLIRALASPDEKVRSKAQYDLCGNIWHQGSIYQATSYAVPFLIELVESPWTPERDWLLFYLANLAEGGSYVAVHKSYMSWEAPAKLAEMEAEELQDVDRTWFAVLKGAKLYLSCLNEPDRQTSSAAANLLSQFPGEADHFLKPIKDRYERSGTDDKHKLGLLLCVRRFLETEPSLVDWLRAQSKTNETRASRVVVAAAIAESVPNELRTEELGLLLDNMLSDDELDEAFSGHPWDQFEPAQVVVESLCKSKANALAAARRFNDLLSAGPRTTRLEYCHYLLHGELPDDIVGQGSIRSYQNDDFGPFDLSDHSGDTTRNPLSSATLDDLRADRNRDKI